MGVDLQLFSDEPPSPSIPSAWQVLQLQLIDSVLAGQTKALHLYADLQSVASLPFKAIPDSASEQTAMAVLQTFVQMHRTNLHIQQKEVELLAKLQDLNIQLEKAKHDAQDAATKASLAQDAAVKAEAKATASEEAAKAAIANIPPPASAPVPVVASADTKVLEEENQLLLDQLHEVQVELERLFMENRQLKFKVAQAEQQQNPKRLGAAEKVKGELPYQLGATLVGSKHSVGGYLALPFRLQRVAHQFKKQQALKRQAATETLLDDYADAHEGERTKEHLSYKLGEVLAQTGSNPLRWATLPFKLQKAHRNWRMNKAP